MKYDALTPHHAELVRPIEVTQLPAIPQDGDGTTVDIVRRGYSEPCSDNTIGIAETYHEELLPISGPSGGASAEQPDAEQKPGEAELPVGSHTIAEKDKDTAEAEPERVTPPGPPIDPPAGPPRGGGDFAEEPEPDPLAAASLARMMRDPELQQRAVTVARVLGPERTIDLIRCHEPFTGDATVEQPDGSTRNSPNHTLKMTLDAMPDLLANAGDAGLTPDKAYALVRTILTGEGRSTYGLMEEPVIQLSRAFKTQAEYGHPFTDEDYTTLHGLVADTAGREDDNLATIDAYRALTRIGFTAAQSDQLIRHELFADAQIINYALRPINALAVAQVDAELLTEVCRLIPGERPHLYSIQASYTMLYDLITIVCPGRELPPNDLLAIVRDQLMGGGNLDGVTQSFIDSGQRRVEGEPVAYHPLERRNTHFIPKPGPLELSPLPYRARRSFRDGAADIGDTVANKPRHRQPIDEGLWVFDRAASEPTWYCVGGETQVDLARGAIRHTYPDYPIGELSPSPVLFHSHPIAYEWLLAQFDFDAVPNPAEPVIRRFLATTPSGRDYAMVADLMRSPDYRGGEVRSFIAHGGGFTEYVFPHDVAALDYMSQMVVAYRNSILEQVRWDRILFSGRHGRGALRPLDDIVGDLIGRVNAILPDGFELKLSGPGEVDL